jgi:hypothetical protein
MQPLDEEEGAKLQLPFGFVVLAPADASGSPILYLRIQDHLRGRGLARMALMHLLKKEEIGDLHRPDGWSPIPGGKIEPSTPESVARFDRLLESARGEWHDDACGGRLVLEAGTDEHGKETPAPGFLIEEQVRIDTGGDAHATVRLIDLDAPLIDALNSALDGNGETARPSSSPTRVRRALHIFRADRGHRTRSIWRLGEDAIQVGARSYPCHGVDRLCALLDQLTAAAAPVVRVDFDVDSWSGASVTSVGNAHVSALPSRALIDAGLRRQGQGDGEGEGGRFMFPEVKWRDLDLVGLHRPTGPSPAADVVLELRSDSKAFLLRMFVEDEQIYFAPVAANGPTILFRLNTPQALRLGALVALEAGRASRKAPSDEPMPSPPAASPG